MVLVLPTANAHNVKHLKILIYEKGKNCSRNTDRLMHVRLCDSQYRRYR